MLTACRINKFIVGVLVLLSVFLGVGSAVQASGLAISPKRVVFEQGQRVFDVVLLNTGREHKTYQISFMNMKIDENGQSIMWEQPAEDEFFADTIVKFTPQTVAIAPGQSQVVRLISQLSDKSNNGEYRSHLLFQELPGSVDEAPAHTRTLEAHSVFGMSIPVILRKGSLNAYLTLSDPVLYSHGGDEYIAFKLHREGNRSILGDARIYLDHKEIGVLKGIAAYLSTDVRRVFVKISSEYRASIRGQQIKVEFTERNNVYSTYFTVP